MEEKSKKRNIYIDLMKGLLITLVVIGHLPYFEYDSRTLVLIYSFHMHAFLIIGGMLSHIDKNTKISTIIYKRLTGTLLPYFIFYLITFIIVPTTTEQKLNAIPVVIKGIGIPPDHALNLPLWFLTFYFVAMTIFEIIQFISHKIVGMIFASHRKHELCETIVTQLISLVLISIIMRISFVYARIYKLPRLPYNIEIAGYCLGFVFFGNAIGRIIPNIDKYMLEKTTNIKRQKISAPTKTDSQCVAPTNIVFKIIVLIISTFVVIVIAKTWYDYSMWNGRIDLNARDYKNAFYMYVDAILGFITFATFSYIIFIVATFAKKRLDILNNDAFDDSLFQGVLNIIYFLLELPAKLFSYLGKNSLYILAYHVPSVFYTSTFIMPHLPISIRETLSHNSLISVTIMSFFGIAFSLLMSLLHKVVFHLIHRK